MAASYYGRARTTRDVDFRLQIKKADLDIFLGQLENHGLKVYRNRIRRQLSSGYNVLELQDSRSPYRVDFIIDSVRLTGIRKGIAFGLRTFYDTPETLILSKLRMIKATVLKEKGYKDTEDIREILQNTRVNKTRLAALAREQGTEEILKQILHKTSERVRGPQMMLKTVKATNARRVLKPAKHVFHKKKGFFF